MPREPVAYIPEDLFEAGIGHIVVCRFKGDGRIEAGAFLLDVFCLGVRDAVFGVYANEDDLREELLGPELSALETRPGAHGRKLVEAAVSYAESLGISPSANYKKGARVFGGIDAADCTEEFTFGKNGKPLLIQSPDDDREKLARIHTTLRARLGGDGYDFIMAGDEEVSGTILAVDSHAGENTEPLPELKDMAEDFLQHNSDLFDQVVHGEAADHVVASTFLNAAREMQQDAANEGLGAMSLEDSLNYLQMVWNLSNMSDEERALALEQVPEDAKPALLFEADSLPERDTPFMILELDLLYAGDPERERLLMLLEPL
jgi:hypothetical protein